MFSNIKFTLYPLCYEVLTKQREALTIEKVLDDLPTPPEPDILRLRFAELTGGNLKKAWESVTDNMPTIASETITNETKSGGPSSKNLELSFDKKMVALLHFGRSGTGYFHSLLDSHPAISTLPGIYMNGYFGRGVWSGIVGQGFKGIAEQFSSLYKVLFDARLPDKVPPAFVSDTHANKSVGVREGFTAMGANRDIPLTLDRGQFVDILDTMLGSCEGINQGQLFEAIHYAHEETLGGDFKDKNLILYHLHHLDPYSMANFLKYFPQAHLLMIIRDPLQSCESWVVKTLRNEQENTYNTYSDIIYRISPMLIDLNSPVFSTQRSVAVRLEDIKTQPEKTMRNLCDYLDIEESPSLYESTMQGLQWWGDPSSSLFGREQTEYEETTDPTGREVGTFFSTKDQFILQTLFYPLSARFGYVEENVEQFRKDLAEVRSLIEKPLDFEEKLAKEFLPDYPDLPMTSEFKHLHAVLIAAWSQLDKHGTYPNMIKALPGV